VEPANLAICQKNARAYLDKLAELAEAPISLVGVGPDREQTLVAE
jgi:adenylosuccinate synthase